MDRHRDGRGRVRPVYRSRRHHHPRRGLSAGGRWRPATAPAELHDTFPAQQIADPADGVVPAALREETGTVARPPQLDDEYGVAQLTSGSVLTSKPRSRAGDE